MGQKQKTERKKEEERKTERWRTQARMAHASRLGQNFIAAKLTTYFSIVTNKLNQFRLSKEILS